MSDPLIPAFWQSVLDLYRDGIAHGFILHGNVRDYIPTPPFLPLNKFLVAALNQSKRDIVITVNPASGIDLPFLSHRKVLLDLLNSPTAPKTPISSVLQKALATTSSEKDVAPIPQNEATMSLGEISILLNWLLTYPLFVPDSSEMAKQPLGADAPMRRVRVGVVFDFADFLLPNADLAELDDDDIRILTRFINWTQSLAVGEQHILIMACESVLGLHSELRRSSARWEAIEVMLPNQAERLRFIESRWQSFGIHGSLTSHDVARLTGGLSLIAIEDCLLRAVNAPLTTALVMERKAQAIKSEYGDVIEIIEPRWTLDAIGGYEYVKDWFRRSVERPWQSHMLRISGIQMSGPPGTGKTTLAEAFAGSLNMPFVVFRMARILGQYVGNSERAMERCLQAFKALAPLIVFFDEIDQILQRGEHGGNGVDNRIFARLLEWLADPERRGNILAIAATNRPDLIDPALASRLDRRIPILPPADADERAAIIVVQAHHQGLPVSYAVARDVAESMHNWSGRNLKDFVAIATELYHETMDEEAALREALTIYRAPVAEIEHQIRLSLADLTDLRLVPPAYRSWIFKPQGAAITDESPTVEPRRGTRTL